MVQIVRELSGNSPNPGVILGDPNAQPLDHQAYILAGVQNPSTYVVTGVTLAAGEGTPWRTVVGGSYLFFTSGTYGTGAAQLQYRGDDGVPYNIDTTRTSAGVSSAQVVIGDASEVRVLNSGAGSLTNFIANLK